MRLRSLAGGMSADHLRRRGLHDGLLGGNRRWLAVGVVVWSLRALELARGRDQEVVYRGKLADGETMVIESLHVPTRRQRRRAVRTERGQR